MSILNFFSSKSAKTTETKVVKTVRATEFDAPKAKTLAPVAEEVDAVDLKVDNLLKGLSEETANHPVVQKAVEKKYRPLAQAQVNVEVATEEVSASIKAARDAKAAVEHVLSASLDLALQIDEGHKKLAQLKLLAFDLDEELKAIEAMLDEPSDLEAMAQHQRFLISKGKGYKVNPQKAQPKAEPSLPKNFSDCTTEAQRAEWVKANGVQITKVRELPEEAPPVVVVNTTSAVADGDSTL